MHHKLTHIILLLFSLTFAFGQTRSFNLYPVKADETKYKSDSLNIFDTYRFDGYTLTVGWTSGSAGTISASKLLVKNQKNQIIFSTFGPSESYIFRPTFFKSENSNDPIIILVESGTEYSWGNTVFSLKGNIVKEFGHIDVAENDTLDHSSNIAPVTKIKFENNLFTFHFNTNSVIFNPGGKNEKVFKGSEICYTYKDGQLKFETPSR